MAKNLYEVTKEDRFNKIHNTYYVLGTHEELIDFISGMIDKDVKTEGFTPNHLLKDVKNIKKCNYLWWETNKPGTGEMKCHVILPLDFYHKRYYYANCCMENIDNITELKLSNN